MKNYTSYDLIEWGKPFEKSQHALPEPTLSEVLIRVTAAGLCHSDLHVQKGYMDLGEEGRLTFAERGAQLPMTFGHEIAGIVEAVGDKVKNVSIGQQVLVFPWIGCGDCLACNEDRVGVSFLSNRLLINTAEALPRITHWKTMTVHRVFQ